MRLTLPRRYTNASPNKASIRLQERSTWSNRSRKPMISVTTGPMEPCPIPNLRRSRMASSPFSFTTVSFLGVKLCNCSRPTMLVSACFSLRKSSWSRRLSNSLYLWQNLCTASSPTRLSRTTGALRQLRLSWLARSTTSSGNTCVSLPDSSRRRMREPSEEDSGSALIGPSSFISSSFFFDRSISGELSRRALGSRDVSGGGFVVVISREVRAGKKSSLRGTSLSSRGMRILGSERATCFFMYDYCKQNQSQPMRPFHSCSFQQ